MSRDMSESGESHAEIAKEGSGSSSGFEDYEGSPVQADRERQASSEPRSKSLRLDFSQECASQFGGYWKKEERGGSGERRDELKCGKGGGSTPVKAASSDGPALEQSAADELPPRDQGASANGDALKQPASDALAQDEHPAADELPPLDQGASANGDALKQPASDALTQDEHPAVDDEPTLDQGASANGDALKQPASDALAQDDHPAVDDEPTLDKAVGPEPPFEKLDSTYFKCGDIDMAQMEQIRFKRKNAVNVTLKGLRPAMSAKKREKLEYKNKKDFLRQYVHMENMLQLIDLSAGALVNAEQRKVVPIVFKICPSLRIPYETLVVGHRLWLRETSLATPLSNLVITPLETRAVFFVCVLTVLMWYDEKGAVEVSQALAITKLHHIINQYYSDKKLAQLQAHIRARLGWEPLLRCTKQFIREFIERMRLPDVITDALKVSALNLLDEVRLKPTNLLIPPSLQATMCIVEAARMCEPHPSELLLCGGVLRATYEFIDMPKCCYILQDFIKDKTPLVAYLDAHVATVAFRLSAFLAWRPLPYMGFDPGLPIVDVYADYGQDEPRLDNSVARVVYKTDYFSSPLCNTSFAMRVSYGDSLPPIYYLDANRADEAAPNASSATQYVKIIDFDPGDKEKYSLSLADLKLLFAIDKRKDPDLPKKVVPMLKKQLCINLLIDDDKGTFDWCKFAASTWGPYTHIILSFQPARMHEVSHVLFWCAKDGWDGDGTAEVVRVLSEDHESKSLNIIRLLLRYHPFPVEHSKVRKQFSGLELCIGSAIALDLMAMERPKSMAESFEYVLHAINTKTKSSPATRIVLNSEMEDIVDESVSAHIHDDEDDQADLVIKSAVDLTGLAADDSQVLKASTVPRAGRRGRAPAAGSAGNAGFRQPKTSPTKPASPSSQPPTPKDSSAKDSANALPHPAPQPDRTPPTLVKRKSTAAFLLGSIKNLAKSSPARPKKPAPVVIVTEMIKKSPEKQIVVKKRKTDQGESLPLADFLLHSPQPQPLLVPIKEVQEEREKGVITQQRIEETRAGLYRMYTAMKDRRFDARPTRTEYLQDTAAVTAALSLLKDLELD